MALDVTVATELFYAVHIDRVVYFQREKKKICIQK